MTLEKWVDFSVHQGRVQRAVLGRMKDDNVRGVCVGSWHGLSANPYVEGILLDARDLGLGTATYAVVNARDGKQTIGLARDACGAAWPPLSFVAIDAEIRGVTHQIIRDARTHIELLGQRPWFYSARWFLSWLAQGIGTPISFMEGLPLWYALYNGVPNLNPNPDLGLWGPWRGPIGGHQYTGSTSAYGTTVDFNVFDSEMVRGTTPPAPPPPPPPPDEEDEMKLIIIKAHSSPTQFVTDGMTRWPFTTGAILDEFRGLDLFEGGAHIVSDELMEAIPMHHGPTPAVERTLTAKALVDAFLTELGTRLVGLE